MNEKEMLNFMKALADSNRLKIIGLLARQKYSVEELAALLDLKAPTISHHLSKLAEVGLVTARAEGYYSVYQLEQQALEAAARSFFSPEQIAAVAEEVDLGAYNRKVLAHFCLPDGGLKEIPAQRKKLEIILQYVLKAFQPGVKYTEKQVNETLSRFHADTATLRRELVGCGLMKRAGGGGDYWVAQEI